MTDTIAGSAVSGAASGAGAPDVATGAAAGLAATAASAASGAGVAIGPDSTAMSIVIVGHVDHGKSTVIGRLLADTNSLPDGKLQQVKDLCVRTSKPFEYAFLLDALKDEQAQGITIDSARVFFKSALRHYIIIDAPGHIEFLKNMITGAARAEAALLVIDAQEGVRENSRRHGYMLSMLGIDQVAVLVNKMDLVGYSEERFHEIRDEYTAFLEDLGVEPAAFVPVSGVEGENIAAPGALMPWYDGPTVLQVLDGFGEVYADLELPFRMPVQDVYKFTRFGDSRRIVVGTVAAGSIAVGDEVVFYPSGKKSEVASIETFPALPEGGTAPAVLPTDAVGFTLTEQLYVNRGQLACRADQPSPRIATRLRASVFWLAREAMTKQKEYLLRVGTTRVPVWLEEITRVIDASTLAAIPDADRIGRHDVAECVLRCELPVAFDIGAELTETSRFVLIDDYEISGGGIVQDTLLDDQAWVRDTVLLRNVKWERGSISAEERSRKYGQKPALVLFTGSANSRKKDLAKALERELFAQGRSTYYLGIGSVVYGIDADLKQRAPDSLHQNREEHLRRFAEAAHLFLDSGLILVASAIDIGESDLAVLTAVLDGAEIVVVGVGDKDAAREFAHLHVPEAEEAGDTDIHVMRTCALLEQRGVVPRG
ncbi:MAG: adenylyl-sulfate kinase [Actinobacteria bacterium]|nr:adenylyl-sulfate kinase [Actinomycetota bacterium]